MGVFCITLHCIMENKQMIEFTEDEIGALLFVLGAEVGYLRAVSEGSSDYQGQIDYYKALAFKINGTDH